MAKSKDKFVNFVLRSARAGASVSRSVGEKVGFLTEKIGENAVVSAAAEKISAAKNGAGAYVRGAASSFSEHHPDAAAFAAGLGHKAGRQVGRLLDVRIGGRRLRDLPEKARRGVERYLLGMFLKIHDADPEFDWDGLIPNTEDLPVFAAFETLGLPYGTPFAEVKDTYRQLVRKYHPDRHAGSPEEEREATAKTQEITAAYELIARHYGV